MGVEATAAADARLRALLERVLSIAHYCEAFKGRIAHVTESLLLEIEGAS